MVKEILSERSRNRAFKKLSPLGESYWASLRRKGRDHADRKKQEGMDFLHQSRGLQSAQLKEG